MTGTNERRDSRALEPELVKDSQKKAEAEARNGLRQYDLGIAAVQEALERGPPFRLRPSLILALHREALAGLSSYAGNWRPGGVEIEKSKHIPPGAHLVPTLVEDLCDYVNENWHRSPVHLSAYCMWRLNWIHPFADGNGRTSRILSYVVMSIRAGYVIPGVPTIPVFIVDNRNPYFEALDAADASLSQGGGPDLSKMEDLLGRLLGKQLANFWKEASEESGDLE